MIKKVLSIFFFLLSFWFAATGQPGKSAVNASHSPIVQGLVNQVNADSIRSYMQSLQDFGSRFCLVENRKDVAMWIKNKFAGFGIAEVRLDSFQLNMTFMGQLHETWQYNVVATLPGAKNAEKIYILGAHHDSVCYDSTSSTPWQCSLTNAPGADDNASGVAAALEVARVMKANGYQPSNTIKFVTFAAEEVGLRGAWDFSNKAANEGMDIKAMINSDMISNWDSANDQWKLQVHGYPGAEWLSELAIAMINNYTVFEAVLSNQSLNATDSWAFHHNGFPALFLHEGQFSPFYHSVNDVVENTNKEYAAEATKVSLALMLHLNGIDEESFIDELSDVLFEALVFPNPFSSNATISLSLFQTQNVSIRVFDSMGRLVIENSTTLTPGTHLFAFDASGLSSGLYLVSVSGGSISKTFKVVKQE